MTCSIHYPIAKVISLLAVFLIIRCGDPEAPQEDLDSITTLRQKLASTIGHQVLPLKKFALESMEGTELFTMDRVMVTNGQDDRIPMVLLKPRNLPPPFQVMICLQGHAPGMYISIGEIRQERDRALVAGGRDLARQAIAHGYAALAVEQYGFGEQAVDSLSCNHLSLNMIMQGQSMIGKRTSDISTAIDFIATQSDLTLDRLGCMGNSSGGTTSYFASALDQRIELTVVSCSFSPYATSWLKYPHCACGYVPGLLNLMDMPEVAQLIVPRSLIIVAGKKDYLADIDSVRDGFAIAQHYYREAKQLKQIQLIEGDGGHQFYPEVTWPVIEKMQTGF